MSHYDIVENSEALINDLSPVVIDYLNRFPSNGSNANGAGFFKIITDSKGITHIWPSSYAGIIEVDGARLNFLTKVRTNIYYMLTFLDNETAFHYDPNTTVEVEGGNCFFDALGRIFCNYLEEVLKKGLLKKYVSREENLRFKRGRLLVKEQIARNLDFKPSFHCRYNDLTCDNLENKIVLRSLNLLIPMIRHSDGLKFDLLRLQRQMLEEVSLEQGISHIDCDSICINRLNQHYTDILAFSRLILMHHYIRSSRKDGSIGFNFLVDMNQLYESFVTEMVRQAVKEWLPGHQVLAQETFQSLDDDGKIRSRPDIIVQGPDGNYPLIIDAKYKRDVVNSDEYQMIAYLLAIKGSRVACLLYPSQEKITSDDLKIKRDLSDEMSGRAHLVIRMIDLHDEGEDFEQFVIRTKKLLGSQLTALLSLKS